MKKVGGIQTTSKNEKKEKMVTGQDPIPALTNYNLMVEGKELMLKIPKPLAEEFGRDARILLKGPYQPNGVMLFPMSVLKNAELAKALKESGLVLVATQASSK